MSIAFVVVPVDDKCDTEALKDRIDWQYNVENRQIFLIPNGTTDVEKGISWKYNKAIEEILQEVANTGDLYKDDDYVLFTHQDVHSKLSHQAVNDAMAHLSIAGADIVGVAGRITVPPISPGHWWHGLGQPNFPGAGAVEHPVPNSPQRFMSTYGAYPQKVAAIDGLWIAVKIGALKDPALRFDPQFAHHFYDMDFCATARILGKKIFVGDISVFHESRGEGAMAQIFALVQKQFINKWYGKQAEYNKL